MTDDMYKYRFTVFTPTYNRGYIIKNLFDSLKKQTFHDFEWIVIDDGSSDNTEELFSEWDKEEKFFTVNYIKVQNGGKHRAINKAAKIAHGEMFFIVDSDDYLSADALEIIDNVEKSIPSSKKSDFCGVCGLRGNSNGALGSSFIGKEYLDITFLERSKYNITGDKSEVFYTDVIKNYPFPEFEGENFITEAIVWDRMAADGLKLRFFNNLIYICDYLEDGLTSSGIDIFIRNPKGWASYINQSLELKKSTGMDAINEIARYYYKMKESLSFNEIANNLNRNPFKFRFYMLGIRLFFKIYLSE